MAELFANSEDPVQVPQNSDLGLHCLPVTLLGVYRLKMYLRISDVKSELL